MSAVTESVPAAVAESSVPVEWEVSTRFLAELGVYTRRVRPQWELCAIARVPSDVFSKLVHGRLPLKPGDERIIRVGALLGLEPHECFEG